MVHTAAIMPTPPAKIGSSAFHGHPLSRWRGRSTSSPFVRAHGIWTIISWRCTWWNKSLNLDPFKNQLFITWMGLQVIDVTSLSSGSTSALSIQRTGDTYCVHPCPKSSKCSGYPHENSSIQLVPRPSVQPRIGWFGATARKNCIVACAQTAYNSDNPGIQICVNIYYLAHF